jgi:SNF2 family DNA or RNA helicase
VTPFPVQEEARDFLRARKTALLANECRTGKTGSALLAAERLAHRHARILIVTTSSGRAVWRRAVKDWLGLESEIVGIDKAEHLIRIVSWDVIRQPKTFAALSQTNFDLLIADESHRAGNPDTKTTQAIYGKFNRSGDRVANGLTTFVGRVWHLSATPAAHDLGQLWPMLRSSAPHLLAANEAKGWPDVLSFDAFRARYCVMRPKKLSAWRTIMVVMGGKNEAELRERLGDWMLRRTQKDVGIRPPAQELMPLIVSPAQRRELVADKQTREIIEAIENGDTRELEMELGPLRRLTGRIKAEAVIAAAKEWLEDNAGDKLVLAYYHREVGDLLAAGLDKFIPMRIDGSTGGSFRETAQERFKTDPRVRVFLAQIDAAGEAIDLSAAPELWFCESSFSPKAMKQMASRISNVNQQKNTYVKVAYIEGSIDEAIQASLMRLWQSIREVVR